MEEHNVRLKQTQTHPKPLISIFFVPGNLSEFTLCDSLYLIFPILWHIAWFTCPASAFLYGLSELV